MADWKQGLRRVLYPAYEARVVRRLPADKLPKHVGVMLDGNRRWAKAVGHDTAHGHRAGAANIEPLLDWCEEAVATLAEQKRWRLHPGGALDLLPAATAERLKAAEEATRDVDGILVNIA